ncbi:MAG: substrate-binding domain-containing protein [Sphaerochaetaceae bacterium]
MTNGKKPTIKDIALQSGYSKTAVSFAFNEPSRISDKARTTILEVANRLGYIPDPMARNFSLHRHMSIGFLLPQEIEYSLGNPYITQVILGIGTICQQQGYTLTLIPPLNHSILDAVKNAVVDGLIAMGMQVGMDIVDMMNTRMIPYVTIDGTPSADMPSVNIKDMEAACKLMSLVLTKEHRNLAIVSLSKDAFSTEGNMNSVPARRALGYDTALRKVGLTLQDENVHHFVSECTYLNGMCVAQEIAKLNPLPTAVVTMSDIVAIGCISYFQSQDIKVPQDISVVGFDNIDSAKLVSPQLTTVDQPALLKGSIAAKALFSMINGEELVTKHMEIPYSIVIRQSLAQARR